MLDEVGGSEYLTALIGEVPTAAHVTRYANIVAEKSLLRKLVTTGMEIAARRTTIPPTCGPRSTTPRRGSSSLPSANHRDFVQIGPVMEHTFDVLDQTFRNRPSSLACRPV